MATAPSHDSTGTAEADSSDAELQARDYGRVAWSVLRQAPLTIVWRIFGNVTALMLRPFALMWLLVVVSMGVTITAGPGAGFERALVAITRTEPGRLLGGFAGAVAVFWLLAFVVDALVSGGVLQLLSWGTRKRPVEGTRRLFEAVGEGFPKIVGLRLLEAAAQLATTLLGLSVALAVTYGFLRGGFDALAWGWKVALLAIPAFLYLSFAILVRFTMRVAAAPLFLHDASAGAAVADAAAFVLRRLAGIYRLLAFAAGVLLVPLIGYWLLLVVSNVVGMQSAYGPLFEALQFVGQIVLFASFALVSVLFDGTLFAFYAEQSGLVRIRGDDSDELPVDAQPDGHSPYDRQTRLEDLLPDSVDHVLDVRSLSEFGESSSTADVETDTDDAP